MANIAIKYRAYPSVENQILFVKTFGCCRKVWNLMLSDKIENYKATRSFGTFTPAMYKEDYEFLKEVDSLALANVQMNQQAAFKTVFLKIVKRKMVSQNISLVKTVAILILQIIRKVLSPF